MRATAEHSSEMTFADYLHASGLNDDPFADAEDGELFFATPQLTQRLDLLQHLILYSDLILVITGAPGSGKTTLLNRLVSVTSQPWHVSVVQAHVEMDVPQFLAKAKQGFDLLGSGLSVIDQVNQLKDAAENWRSNSQTPLLVVDEAHLLSTDALNKVVQLASEVNQAGLRILLLGEPQLVERLTAAATHAPGGHIMHLVDMPAFNESQTAEYLRYRVRRSGLDAAALFPDDVAGRLYKSSEGLPGGLNAAARDLLADRLESTQKGSQPAPSPSRRFRFLRRGPGLAIEAALRLALAGSFWLAIRGSSVPPPQPVDLPSVPEAQQASKPSYEPATQKTQPATVPITALEAESPPPEGLAPVAEAQLDPLEPLEPLAPPEPF